MSQDDWVLIALGFFALADALAICFAWQAIDRRSMWRVGVDHAKAIDRHSTELEIIEQHLGISVDWDGARDGKVPYTVPPSPSRDVVRMDA